MDLELVESFEIEALSGALERLKIPTFNIKKEVNPMVDITITTQDFHESSTTEIFMNFNSKRSCLYFWSNKRRN